MKQSHTLTNPSDDTVLSQTTHKPTDVIADMTMKPRNDTTPKVNEYNEDATTDDEMDNQSTFPEGETRQEDLRKRNVPQVLHDCLRCWIMIPDVDDGGTV